MARRAQSRNCVRVLREHAGLSVPRVRLSCGVHSQQRRGEVYIGKTVDDRRAEVNGQLCYTRLRLPPSLGTLMRLLHLCRDG